jgi:hypothetical protein
MGRKSNTKRNETKQKGELDKRPLYNQSLRSDKKSGKGKATTSEYIEGSKEAIIGFLLLRLLSLL